MTIRAGIIDYEMGNLRSVQKALESVGAEADIVSDPGDLKRYSHIILPGVGAFRDAIAQLRKSGMADAFLEMVGSGRPCLGVCLGLQLLFERSFEAGEHEGLGLLKGDVVRFEAQEGLKIPHMGWNHLKIERQDPLMDGLGESPCVYFVHSYHAVAGDQADVIATSDHGSRFVAAVGRGNLRACQFHPEKSQAIGLKIYQNFMKMT
ncbi:MAG: imidazole glycerol phosphate synthase subunit HisH [Planctomycetota bacterium]|nr:imidazole glycerol phosphate synthase subunit HisH [Planctomycetota bacterium]